MIKSLFPWRQPRETIEDVRALSVKLQNYAFALEHQLSAARIRIAETNRLETTIDVLTDRLERIAAQASGSINPNATVKRMLAIATEPNSVREPGRSV